MSAYDNENNNNQAAAGNIHAMEIMASNPPSSAATALSGVGLRPPLPMFMTTAMNGNPFLSQQQLLRLQEREMPAAASPASVLGLTTNFPSLGHNNAEMEMPHHTRPIEANASRRLFAAAQNNASMMGIAHYNPFNPESIEEIVAVQEQQQRRREMELLLAQSGGLQGHQLGRYALNLPPRAHQNHSLAHLSGSAPMAASSGSQLAASLTNPPLGGLSGEAGGMVRMSERNHSNNEYHSQMLQRQNHLDHLMRLQQFDVSNRLQLGHVAAPGLGQALSNGINRFQPSMNGLSPNTSNSTSNNINLPATSTNVNPSIQKIFLHDKLRYFNNGAEVDMNGNPLPKTASFENPMANVNNFKALQDNRFMSLFVDLVLSQIPEMSHIMARYLTSLNAEAQQEIDGGLARSDLMNKNLSSVIDKALAELKSIDQNDLNAIDPKCSDLAVRVAKCIGEIEAFKEKNCESSLSTQPLSQPNISVSSPNQDISVSTPNQDDQDKEKSKSNKKTHRNEDDLPLMQVYKRSKKSAKKAAKSKAKNVTADSNAEKRFKRPDGLESEEKTSPRVVLNSALVVPEQQSSNQLHNKASTVHSPEQKDPTLLPYDKKSTNIENSAELTKTAIKGPHGDLLGLLFSAEAPTLSSLPTLKKDPGKTSVDSAQTQKEDSGGALKKDASDDELSVAGVLLGLGK